MNCHEPTAPIFASMTISITITGKVQGVYYRASTKEEAQRLGITGWVKNTRSGDVEILASGTGESLDQFIHWCKQGPPNAIVKEVLVAKATDDDFDGFVVMRGSH